MPQKKHVRGVGEKEQRQYQHIAINRVFHTDNHYLNRGERLDISIKPGMCIRANIVGSDEASSTLVADIVRVQPEDRIVFSGLLQAVELDNGFITILDRRILITSETSIPVGFKHRKLKAICPFLS